MFGLLHFIMGSHLTPNWRNVSTTMHNLADVGWTSSELIISVHTEWNCWLLCLKHAWLPSVHSLFCAGTPPCMQFSSDNQNQKTRVRHSPPVKEGLTSGSYNLYDLCMFYCFTNSHHHSAKRLQVTEGSYQTFCISLPAQMYRYSDSKLVY